MRYLNFIGIDVSKSTLAVSVRGNEEEEYYLDLENSRSQITKFIRQYKKDGGNPEKTIVCMEHTGVYTYYALHYFYEQGFVVWIEHALNIKNSIRMTRGKNDKVDAYRIAEYAFRFQDKLVKWEPQRRELVKLKKLFSVRDSLIKTKQKAQLSCSQHQGYEEKEIAAISKQYLAPVVDKLSKQIEKVSEEIRSLIRSDQRFKELETLVASVPGIGEVVSWKLIVATNEFKDFQSGSKFACYSGVVPFEHQSGTSIKSRARVSQMANKEIKTLLHLSAVAILSRGKGELYEYYQRKLLEGKVKMSVINALRNKIIQRVFACVKNNRKYEETYANSLA